MNASRTRLVIGIAAVSALGLSACVANNPSSTSASGSAGASDAPLTASADLIALLDATRRIGLAMTRSYMMTPIKSVTALIGISDQNEDRTRDCSRCSAGPDCPYRKRGESCGG